MHSRLGAAPLPVPLRALRGATRDRTLCGPEPSWRGVAVRSRPAYQQAMKRIISGLCALGLVACGGGNEEASGPEEHAEHHGEHHSGGEHHGSGDDHPGMPPAVDHFHSVLGPIWHAEPGDTRRALACDTDNLSALDEAAADVAAMEALEGADETDWNVATEALTASVAEVAVACDTGGDAAEDKLSAVHDAFHAIAELASSEESE